MTAILKMIVFEPYPTWDRCSSLLKALLWFFSKIRQQKRHWCIEQSFGLCGRGRRRGWDDLGEGHWNMYNIVYETSHQSRFNAQYWMLGAGALGWCRGMVRGRRREEGSGWGTHVYLWRIHFDIWQNQYNIVKLKKKEHRKKIRLCHSVFSYSVRSLLICFCL